MPMKQGPPADDSTERTCQWCGARFRQAATGRTARYCRRSCRQRAYEQRRELERTAYAVREAQRGGSAKSRRNAAIPQSRLVRGGEDVPLW